MTGGDTLRQAGGVKFTGRILFLTEDPSRRVIERSAQQMVWRLRAVFI